MTQLPQSFIQASLKAPDLEKLKDVVDPFEFGTDFLETPEIYSVYEATLNNIKKSQEVLTGLTTLIPQAHPYYAAQLALFAGTLVDAGANARTAFLPCLELMQKLVNALHPYWGYGVDPQDIQEATQEQDTKALEQFDAALKNFERVKQKIAQLSADEMLELTSYQHALDILVIPFMAMLMRDVKNIKDFSDQQKLISHINDLAFENDTFPLFELHFIAQATQLYYGKLTVILPTSQTGFLAHAHGINNAYHALSLLQDLMAHHAEKIQVGQINPSLKRKSNKVSKPRYQWLNAVEYAQKNTTQSQEAQLQALSWGTHPLQQLVNTQSEVILFAQELDESAIRKLVDQKWDEAYLAPIHSAQNANIIFVKELSKEEVEKLL